VSSFFFGGAFVSPVRNLKDSSVKDSLVFRFAVSEEIKIKIKIKIKIVKIIAGAIMLRVMTRTASDRSWAPTALVCDEFERGGGTI